jgi:hypothetical protein
VTVTQSGGRLDTSAAFFRGGVNVSNGCTDVIYGDCHVLSCAATGTGTTSLASAGIITVAGPTGDFLMVSPTSGGLYISTPSMTMLYNTGDLVSIQADGTSDGVPAFSRSLVAPAPITVTAPALDTSTALIMRSLDFNVAWTGGTARTNVEASISPSTQGTEVRCEFDAAAGTGMIPIAALQQLPQGTATLSITPVSKVDVMAGEFRVTLELATTGASGAAALD